MAEEEDLGNFSALRDIIARLRGSAGCPWDRQQTHDSLKPYLVEECYEVLQALENDTAKRLCEELGDLLLQIMLHAQISADEGEFDIEDVIRGLNAKLIRRHPHVFGGDEVKDVKELKLNWETLKQEERQEDESLLSGVPKQMPALACSQSVQRRVAAVGFDWENTEDIVDKLVEEVDEFRGAASQDERAREFGDLLFTLANIARRIDIDLEMALRASNQRFCSRFSYMETVCRQRSIRLGDLSLDEQNVLWDEAKRNET